ncbi:MAG: LuxR C-terminal-related transcriptional regulator [Gammaproteobacteria bacterium]
MSRIREVNAHALVALEQGRERYRQHAWADAFNALSLADQEAELLGEDLELLATSAYLIGQDEDYLRALERAYAAYLDVEEFVRAVRCAFWMGFRLMFRGEMGHATGWLARARRLLEPNAHECAERGYLLLPEVEQRLAADDCDAAYAAAADAAAIGERCREADLIACARHQQGRIRLQQGQVAAGLALLDETMVAVTGGELSPIVTGLVYCSVVAACQRVYALDRAREWTTALARWCEGQPEMVAFAGVCQVHRAEIMQLQGAWLEAIQEAQHASERCLRAANRKAAAAAFYQQAELLRLQGDFVAAEEAYRRASQWGWDPQPGLALLRNAQGRTDVAVAAIRRVVNATTDELERVKLLPAYIEIMLAGDDGETARDACRELETIAQRFGTDVLGAIAGQARGAVELAGGNAQAALGALRRAWQVWEEMEAPYLAARVRELMARACRALDDSDGYALEIAAVRAAFEKLGAAADLTRLDAVTPGGQSSSRAHGLTPRELQVLRLVAAGKTNKTIAAGLFLSERTIDRHLSNIFTKLNVSSRVAATAYAYEHKLV